MSIALVTGQKVGQDSGSSTGTTFAATLPANITTGNLVVCHSGNDTSGGATTTGVSDTANTYNINQGNARANNATSQQRIDGHYKQNVLGGVATVTATFSVSCAFRQVHASEYSAADTVSPLDQTAGATGTGTTYSSGAKTPTTDGQLIYGGEGAGSGTITQGSGFTLLVQGSSRASEYQIQAAAASISADFTGTSSNFCTIMMTFKAAVTASSLISSQSRRGLPVPGLRGPQTKAWLQRARPLAAQGSAGAVASSVLSAPGDSTATFVGAAQDNSVLAAAGDATATFTGASKAAAVLSAAADATATFTGAAKAASVLSAAADATASFTGAALAKSVLAAPGDATASFTGAALDRGVLNAPGDSTLSFVGRSDAAAVWNAAADASAAWIGSTGGNVLSASGDSSGIFVGAELAAAVLAAAGDSSALWSGTFTLPGGDELGARRPVRGRAKARKPPKQRRPVYRHPEEVERERRMLEEYLESLETKARPASEEPVRPGESQEAPTRRAEPVAPRLSDVMARLASAQQLELIARAERVAEEDRAKAQKEHKRRRAAATAVLMMSH